ncbi:MAG TPA: hypothetical protein QF764_07430 [Planctomycetota bacterium]|jgi:DNA-directed RNA polymerase specialized sigma24 family protein|nr:hypothetical protein [Planctomycetota bacterium]
MIERSSEPSAFLEEASRFAKERLGPGSAELLEGPGVQAGAFERFGAGATVEDATLAVVFEAGKQDRRLMDEFLVYLLGDTMRAGHSLLNPGLREHVDTVDLVDSVMGDLWAGMEEVAFRTRGQFIAFLLRKMRWKARTKLRAANREKRGGGQRVGGDVTEFGVADPGPSPISSASHRDELRRLALVLFDLDGADREIVRLHIDGVRPGAIATRLALPPSRVTRTIDALIRRMSRGR